MGFIAVVVYREDGLAYTASGGAEDWVYARPLVVGDAGAPVSPSAWAAYSGSRLQRMQPLH